MRFKVVFAGVMTMTVVALGSHAGDKAPEACAKASDLIGQLEQQYADTAVQGDLALKQFTDFTATGSISYGDSTKFYDETKNLEDGIELMMKTVSDVDNLFPSGADMGLQLLHLKVGLAMEPIRPFAKLLVGRMMSTINCDLGDAFAACQAKVLSPAYGFDKDGVHKEFYAAFKKQAQEQIIALKVFFRKNTCGSDFKLINPLPPGAEDDAPVVVKTVPKPATPASTTKKPATGKRTAAN